MYMPKSAVLLPDEKMKNSSYMPNSARPLNPNNSGNYLKETAENFLPSLGQNIKGMAEGAINFLNPDPNKNTAMQINRLAIGALQKLDPTKNKTISSAITDSIRPLYLTKGLDTVKNENTNYEPVADAVGKFYKNRYGGIENIKKTIHDDPAGVLLDASVVADAAGGALKGIGAISKSSKLAEAGELASKVGKTIDPVSQMGKGLGTVAETVQPKIANIFENLSEQRATSGLGNPMKLKQIEGITGKSAGQLIREYNLFDRTPESVGEAVNKIEDVLSEKVKNAPKTNANKILESFDKKIDDLKENASLSDATKGELADLVRRKKDFIKAIKYKKNAPIELSAEKIREFKQAVGNDIPDNKFLIDATQTAKSNAAKKVYNIFKDEVNRLADTKQLGKDESGLLKLKQVFANAEARNQAKQIFSLSDFGASGLGGMIAGWPGAIATAAAKRLIYSPQGIKFISTGANDAAKAIKNVKIPSKYQNIFSNLYIGSKANRVLNR